MRAGEIVGLAGLQGSGRSEIGLGTFGVAPFTRGTVEVRGRVHRPSPSRSARAGVALVSEDRKAEGLALNQRVSANTRLVLDGAFGRSARRRAKAIPDVLALRAAGVPQPRPRGPLPVRRQPAEGGAGQVAGHRAVA